MRRLRLVRAIHNTEHFPDAIAGCDSLQAWLAGKHNMNRFSAWLFLVGAPLALWAQTSPPENVTQIRNDRRLELQVSRPTALKELILLLCSAVEARCEVPAGSGSDLVPAMVIRGTWMEVMKHLLDGTRNNYLAAETSARLPLLIVRRQSRQSKDDQRHGSENLSSQSFPEQDSESLGPVLGQAELPASATLNQPHPTLHWNATALDVLPASPPRLNGRQVGPQTHLPFTGILAQDDVGRNPNRSPFPGRPGAPVSTRGPARFWPFPDSGGKLIPVRPTIPGSPFPSR